MVQILEILLNLSINVQMENLNIFMHLNQMKLILIEMINYINTLDCKDKITPIKCGIGYKR